MLCCWTWPAAKILQTFDLSTNDLVPSSFPYTVVATRDGRRAWCSLWNASQVAELDLTNGKVTGWIKLKQPQDPLAPGSHPTAMLLSPDEKTLYVALSNLDQVAEVSTADGTVSGFLSTASPSQKFSGTLSHGSRAIRGRQISIRSHFFAGCGRRVRHLRDDSRFQFASSATCPGIHSHGLVSQRPRGP